MSGRLQRRSILSSVVSAGLVSLAGCSVLRSDDALDVVVENEASSDHDVRIFIPARTEAFDETTTVAAGDETTYEDAIAYPEHPEAVEYDVDIVGYPFYERGTLALDEELERFGFRIVESNAEDATIDVLTLRDYRD